MGVYLPPFDPSREFVAIRFFRYDGVIYSRRDPFPKEGLAERKLRQLYETRNIGYAEDNQVRSFPPPPPPYAEGEVRPDGGNAGDLNLAEASETATTEAQLEAAKTPTERAEQQDAEGASGTAREAPGAPESTDATSGEASAPADDAEASADGEGGPTEEGAAAPQAKTDKPQLDHDKNGEAGGSLPDNEGERETLIKRLANRHTHDELFAKASGLKGVKKSQTKAEIAAALVDAGRVGDDGPA